MTDELSPQARAFLELAQQDSEIEATPEDRARVSKALTATLAAGAAVGSAALAKASGSSGLFGFFASAGASAKGLMLVLAVGGAVAMSGQLMTEPSHEEPVQSPSDLPGAAGPWTLATDSLGQQRGELEDGVETVAPEPVEESESIEHAAETASALDEMPALDEMAMESAPVQTVRRRAPSLAEDSAGPGAESAASGDGLVVQREPEGMDAPEDDGANEETSAPSLAEELALLRQAQAARTRGDTRAAMALLDEHAARFPTGTFVAEREGSRALIRCAAPGRSDAERVDIGQRFVRRFATSPLRRRVEQACQPASSEETPSGRD